MRIIKNRHREKAWSRSSIANILAGLKQHKDVKSVLDAYALGIKAIQLLTKFAPDLLNGMDDQKITPQVLLAAVILWEDKSQEILELYDPFFHTTTSKYGQQAAQIIKNCLRESASQAIENLEDIEQEGNSVWEYIPAVYGIPGEGFIDWIADNNNFICLTIWVLFAAPNNAMVEFEDIYPLTSEEFQVFSNNITTIDRARIPGAIINLVRQKVTIQYQPEKKQETIHLGLALDYLFNLTDNNFISYNETDLFESNTTFNWEDSELGTVKELQQYARVCHDNYWMLTHYAGENIAHHQEIIDLIRQAANQECDLTEAQIDATLIEYVKTIRENANHEQ